MKNNLEIVKKIISEKFGVTAEQINPHANLRTDLNLSKLEIIDLIDLLPSAFNISIPDDLSIDSLHHISDILNIIEQQSLDL